MTYLGDFNPGDTVRHLWNSNDSNGASITRSTNGTIAVYKNLGTTQSTSGVTDTEDFDSTTGLHAVSIDTSADGTFYSAAGDYHVVLTGAVIDTRTVNAYLFSFSIQNRSGLRPTVAGRTLDVSSTGEAGLDWANVGGQSTAVNLSATNIDTDQVVASVTTKTGYELADGALTAAKIGADAFTAAKFAADVTTELQSGLATAANLATLQTTTDAILVDTGTDIPAQLDTIDNFLDTEIAAIKAKTDNLPASPAATGDAMTLTSGERNSVATALLDLSNGVETSFTVRATLRLMAAALVGELSGAASTTIVIRDIGDTKTRISATVDADGNRTALTLDAS